MTPFHLTDEILNRYLDHDLGPSQRASADAHLAACDPCAGRLARLQRLVARFQTLTETPPVRDLSAGVLAAIAQAPAPHPPAPRPALRWVVAAQALAALVLLAPAWPFAASFVSALPAPLQPAAPDLDIWLTQAEGWLAAIANPSQVLRQAWSSAQNLWSQAAPAIELRWPVAGPLAPIEAGLLAVVAGALWLVVNALLLRRPNASRLRRNS